MENIQFSIDFDGRKLMRDDKRSCLIIVDNQQKNLPDILKKKRSHRFKRDSSFDFLQTQFSILNIKHYRLFY